MDHVILGLGLGQLQEGSYHVGTFHTPYIPNVKLPNVLIYPFDMTEHLELMAEKRHLLLKSSATVDVPSMALACLLVCNTWCRLYSELAFNSPLLDFPADDAILQSLCKV